MCGRLEPPLAVGASQVGQRTSLLEPSAQRRLDVAVDVSEEEMIDDSLTYVMVKHSQPGGGQTQDNDNKKIDSAPISHEQYSSKKFTFVVVCILFMRPSDNRDKILTGERTREPHLKCVANSLRWKV